MHKEGCERERELHVMVTRLSTAGDGFENGVHIMGVQGKPNKSISVEEWDFWILKSLSLLLDLENSLIAQIIYNGTNPLLFTKSKEACFLIKLLY